MKKSILLFVLIFSIPLFSVERSEREEILEKPVWKQIYLEYRPDDGLIEALKSKISKIDLINIYYAFWCGDSENNIPPFIKILDEIGAAGVKVNYFSCDRKKSGEKFYFKKLNLLRIPTFIFFKNGKEVGRIIENPKKTLEEDLLDILF